MAKKTIKFKGIEFEEVSGETYYGGGLPDLKFREKVRGIIKTTFFLKKKLKCSKVVKAQQSHTRGGKE